MSDTTTIWDVSRARGDWQISSLQLASGGDLGTAVLISLFSDRAAADDDVIPDGTDNPRGWWGDAGEDVPIGSRLWLLARSKLTTAVANKAVDYAKESLQWLITDGVAASVAVTYEIRRPYMLGLQVIVTRSNGTRETFNFDWAWNEAN
ncbi:phage GP46 family protein [Telmatospirillum sp.]|uniref:phage GP46 family protein n=1 Tax=Telmatospirillum sp. TaxID=2079197 RepID=UPI00284A9880|nr:phage GP46 family protein [Telmatospirillum sp.]MDR3438943.1 phage GP46 family protein [Telmatospirillum sp.]